MLPTSLEDWRNWVSASRTRNYCIEDTLTDWLDLYGERFGFTKDDSLPDYDSMYDWSKFIFEKGNLFEDRYIDYLKEYGEVVKVGDFTSARNIEKASETVEAMENQTEIITQGVLRNPENQTYGLADLLIRLDVLLEAKEIFPNILEIEKLSGIDIKDKKMLMMYRVIDIKFSTLNLKIGNILQSSHKSHMVQLDIYNRAVGRVQNFTPKFGYIVGRKWKQGKFRGNKSTEKLGIVDMEGEIKKGLLLSEFTDKCINWRKNVQTLGENWKVFPSPHIIEMYPNTGISNTGWDKAKSFISWKLNDITKISYVSPSKREIAHKLGIKSIDHPNLSSDALKINGKSGVLVDNIIKVNRKNFNSILIPKRIRSGEEIWRSNKLFEFFVDFETVSDLDDDFTKFPESGGQQIIFQIGCGYVENSNWKFKQFTTDLLDTESELIILDDWFSFMRMVSKTSDYVVYHWSGAEKIHIESAYDNARNRHPNRQWPNIFWFDLLKNIFDAEPVTVKGAYGLGLKQIAKALKRHGAIETTWENGPTDGMGAMVGAWRANFLAKEEGLNLAEYDIMKLIGKYNEVDCRVMQEILYYIRDKH